MINQSVTIICEFGFAVQAGTPMAVNDDDTLALDLDRVFSYPGRSNHSHSMVPGGLLVIS